MKKQERISGDTPCMFACACMVVLLAAVCCRYGTRDGRKQQDGLRAEWNCFCVGASFFNHMYQILYSGLSRFPFAWPFLFFFSFYDFNHIIGNGGIAWLCMLKLSFDITDVVLSDKGGFNLAAGILGNHTLRHLHIEGEKHSPALSTCGGF